MQKKQRTLPSHTVIIYIDTVILLIDTVLINFLTSIIKTHIVKMQIKAFVLHYALRIMHIHTIIIHIVASKINNKLV